MTPLDRVRAIALTFPEASEAMEDGQPTFVVDGTRFARVGEAEVRVRMDDGDEQAFRTDASADPDWPAIEDAIARGWELAAPDRLLEAGGR